MTGTISPSKIDRFMLDRVRSGIMDGNTHTTLYFALETFPREEVREAVYRGLTCFLAGEANKPIEKRSRLLATQALKAMKQYWGNRPMEWAYVTI